MWVIHQVVWRKKLTDDLIIFYTYMHIISFSERIIISMCFGVLCVELIIVLVGTILNMKGNKQYICHHVISYLENVICCPLETISIRCCHSGLEFSKN